MFADEEHVFGTHHLVYYREDVAHIHRHHHPFGFIAPAEQAYQCAGHIDVDVPTVHTESLSIDGYLHSALRTDIDAAFVYGGDDASLGKVIRLRARNHPKLER